MTMTRKLLEMDGWQATNCDYGIDGGAPTFSATVGETYWVLYPSESDVTLGGYSGPEGETESEITTVPVMIWTAEFIWAACVHACRLVEATGEKDTKMVAPPLALVQELWAWMDWKAATK
jgi:hypothetical protein